MPKALNEAEVWGKKSADRRNMNVLEMKCLRSFVEVTRMDRIANEAVSRRAGIECKLTSRADQSVLGWFGHLVRMDKFRIARRLFLAEGSENDEAILLGSCVLLDRGSAVC